MKHSHFENKNLATDPLSSTNNDDSMTNVHFSDYANQRWKGGNRVARSIRINDSLYLEFKPIAQRCFGSVCRAVESFMAATVVSAEHNVHFCNTTQPIKIDKIVIERNLRPRRKLEYEEEVITRKVKRRVSEVAPLNYDDMTLEDLQREYGLAKSARQYGRSMVLGALLKKRRGE